MLGSWYPNISIPHSDDPDFTKLDRHRKTHSAKRYGLSSCLSSNTQGTCRMSGRGFEKLRQMYEKSAETLAMFAVSLFLETKDPGLTEWVLGAGIQIYILCGVFLKTKMRECMLALS
jgi:hypothetical protein